VAERKRKALLLLPQQKEDAGSLKRNPIYAQQHRRNSQEMTMKAPKRKRSFFGFSKTQDTPLDRFPPLNHVVQEPERQTDFQVTENLLLTHLSDTMDAAAVAQADVDSDEEDIFDGRGTPPPQVSGPHSMGHV
jgi:hypothetical protein